MVSVAVNSEAVVLLSLIHLLLLSLDVEVNVLHLYRVTYLGSLLLLKHGRIQREWGRGSGPHPPGKHKW